MDDQSTFEELKDTVVQYLLRGYGGDHGDDNGQATVERGGMGDV